MGDGMIVAAAIVRALRAAGVPIDGVCVYQVDARALLESWTKAREVTSKDESFDLVDEGGAARTVTANDAAEIAQKIARYTAMVAAPDTRPWDKSRWRVDFTPNATKAHRDQAAAIIESFDPETVKPPRRVDFEDALDRLTDQEWSDLQSAIAGNVRLARWYERAKTRGSIDLRDPEVKTALAAVVGAGLFTKQRLSTIFAEAVE
jgi:hypothetical protein